MALSIVTHVTPLLRCSVPVFILARVVPTKCVSCGQHIWLARYIIPRPSIRVREYAIRCPDAYEQLGITVYLYARQSESKVPPKRRQTISP